MNRFINLIRQNRYLLLILCIGIFSRVYHFNLIPPGLNQDEATIGYDAWSILHYGIERNGHALPLVLEAWGSGQNALYAYLAMPFIYFLGLNSFAIRLVNLILGICTLFVFYPFAKEVANKKIALLAVFILAICPWHIMLSRWALESNIFPFFFLCGNYFLIKSIKKNSLLLLGFIFFGLSLYAYGPSYFVVPFFLFFIVIYLLFFKKINRTYLIVSLGTFFILALPILLYLGINYFEFQSIKILNFTIPNLSGPPRYENEFLNQHSTFDQIISNIKNTVNLLIWQDDGLIWNNIPPFGTLYLFSLPFLIVGLLKIFWIKIKEFSTIFFIIIWFIAALVLGALIYSNINRINIIFLPLIIIIAFGIDWLVSFRIKFAKILLALIVATYLISFAIFITAYFKIYPSIIGPVFFESLDQAISFASQNINQPICITRQINMPDIFVLFYNKIDPNIFHKTVVYENPGADFQKASSFDRFYFDLGYCLDRLKIDDMIYIFDNNENDFFSDNIYSIKKFKHYSVATPLKYEK
jgi:4-amino-4-deoxy-L-arabinose transferase-like glycosyltransferase